MKPGYSWKTDEEADDAPDQEQPLPQARRTIGSRRLTFIVLIAATVLMFAAMTVLFNRRIKANEDAVQRDVTAAFQTWRQAVEGHDLELFTSLLSRQDMDWFLDQRRIFMVSRTLERTALGIRQDGASSRVESVKLDPNWREAEVTFSQPYVAESTAGQTQAFELRHTRVFRLQGDRWLQAEPDEDYWGEIDLLQTPHLVVSFPERDRELVARLAAKLEDDIATVCEQWLAVADRRIPDCDEARKQSVLFETDSQSLIALADETTPLMRGQTFLLPAPSLVGVPDDEAAFEALYRGYTGRILAMLRNSLGQPISFPDEDLAALCFPQGERRLALQLFNPSAASWERVETTRPYWFLQPLPDARGVVLRGGAPGTNLAYLQLAMVNTDGETLLYEEGTTELSARLVGVTERGDEPGLLLSAVQGSTGLTDYRYLPLDQCAGDACPISELPGYTVWSPDGQRSLVMREGELFLGDGNAERIAAIGRAFSPFWLTDDTFGYIRLLGDAGSERPDMEVTLQSAASGLSRALFRTRAVNEALGLPEGGNVRILYVTPHPSDDRTYFVAVSSALGGTGRYDVVKVSVDGEIDPLAATTQAASIEVVQTLDRRPVGERTTLLPTGYAPFSMSSDGRWLMSVTFEDPITNRWRVYLYDNETDASKTLTTNYPSYPAPFPYYAWSDDGQWLALVDNGIMRLIAPAYDYERVFAHDFDSCRYIGWVSPDGLPR